MNRALSALFEVAATAAWAGGYNDGVAPGANPNFTGKINAFKTPSGRGGPHTLVITDDQSTIWFTMQSGDKVASLDTNAMKVVKEYQLPHGDAGAYALNTDGAGMVW